MSTSEDNNDHVHLFNPDPTVRNITRTGNTIFFPQYFNPEDVCVGKLKNFVTELDTNEVGYQPPTNGGTPLIWNDATCRVEPSSWPCPTVVQWDNSQQVAPSADDCDNTCKSYTKFIDVNSGLVTHECIGGVVYPIGQPIATVRICYDFSQFTFPATYGGGGGRWDVYNQNLIDTPCSTSSPQNFANPTTTAVDYACWNDPGNSQPPTTNPAGLGWLNFPTNPDSNNLTFSVNDSSLGCVRPGLRVTPIFPSDATGPIRFSFLLGADSDSNGSWIAYDRISGQRFTPLTLTQPPGSTAAINGSYVTAATPLAGQYTTEFDLASVPGATANNISFALFGFGESNAVDFFQVTALEVTPNAAGCCEEWATTSGIVAWMNTFDPNANRWPWGACDNQACAVMPASVAQNYGIFASCETFAAPTITAYQSGCVNATADNEPCTPQCDNCNNC